MGGHGGGVGGGSAIGDAGEAVAANKTNGAAGGATANWDECHTDGVSTAVEGAAMV